MSATRTILFGTAFGLAAGAAVFAYNGDTTISASEYSIESRTRDVPGVPMDAASGVDRTSMNARAERLAKSEI